MTRKAQIVVSVIAFQEGDWWTAQCLEYDIAAQAKTFSDLRYEMDRVFVSHIAVSQELGKEPFAGIAPAPGKYWKMFEEAKLRVEREELPFRVPAPDDGSVMVTPRLKIAEQHVAAH
jgi:hypothetical protein